MPCVKGDDMGCLRHERARQLIENLIQTGSETRNTPGHDAILHIELTHICRAYADTGRNHARRRHLDEEIAAYAQTARIFKDKEQFDNWAVSLAG